MVYSDDTFMVMFCESVRKYLSEPFQCKNSIYAYANRLDPGRLGGWPEIQPICYLVHHFSQKNPQNLKVLYSRQQYNLFLENYPAFKGLNSLPASR